MADDIVKAGATGDDTLDDAVLKEKKARRKARRAEREGDGPAEKELNLTAMMDILTILVVFLLKNYNTTPAANLREGLNPPISDTQIAMKNAITVAVSRKDISVDDQPVLNLDNGRVRPEDTPIAEQPLLITKLRDTLLTKVEHHKKIESLGGTPFKGEMLVVGDRHIDYELLSKVLYSAGQAQLANFKFVTLSP